jgi:hypothetical protein
VRGPCDERFRKEKEKKKKHIATGVLVVIATGVLVVREIIGYVNAICAQFVWELWMRTCGEGRLWGREGGGGHKQTNKAVPCTTAMA